MFVRSDRQFDILRQDMAVVDESEDDENGNSLEKDTPAISRNQYSSGRSSPATKKLLSPKETRKTLVSSPPLSDQVRVFLHRFRLAYFPPFSSNPRRFLSSLAILVAVLSILIWNLFSHCVLFPSLYYTLYPLPPPLTSSAWMDPREIQTIERYLDNNMSMLEFGSGSSSFYFSELVKFYVSVEHDSNWCYKMRQITQEKLAAGKQIIVKIIQLRRSEDSNDVAPHFTESVLFDTSTITTILISPASPTLHVYCIPPNAPRLEESTPISKFCCCFFRCPTQLHSYSDYVGMVDWLWQKYAVRWNAVLVDGRARAQAAYYVIPYLTSTESPVIPTHHTRGKIIEPQIKSPSYVFLHDWNTRRPYHTILKWYEIIDAQYDSDQPGGGGLIVVRTKQGVKGTGGEELADVPWWWF